jgi:hypothetical protein
MFRKPALLLIVLSLFLASCKETVSFTAKVDKANATKDGIYMNGYVVNMDPAQIEKLNGKTIRVTGKVTTVEGVNNSNGGEMQQGRETDTKHILSPKIEIIEN